MVRMHGSRLYFGFFCARRYCSQILGSSICSSLLVVVQFNVQFQALNISFVYFKKSNVINTIDHINLLDGIYASCHSKKLVYLYFVKWSTNKFKFQLSSLDEMDCHLIYDNLIDVYCLCIVFMVISRCSKIEASHSFSFLYVDLCI